MAGGPWAGRGPPGAMIGGNWAGGGGGNGFFGPPGGGGINGAGGGPGSGGGAAAGPAPLHPPATAAAAAGPPRAPIWERQTQASLAAARLMSTEKPPPVAPRVMKAVQVCGGGRGEGREEG